MAYVIHTPSQRLESCIIHTPADVGQRLDSYLFHMSADAWLGQRSPVHKTDHLAFCGTTLGPSSVVWCVL